MFCLRATFVAPVLTKCLAIITWHNTRRASDLHYSVMWLFATCLVITEFLSWQQETIYVISLRLIGTSLSSWDRINDSTTRSRTRDSSVGTATRYGLQRPGIESRWGRDFPHPSKPARGPTNPPVIIIIYIYMRKNLERKRNENIERIMMKCRRPVSNLQQL